MADGDVDLQAITAALIALAAAVDKVGYNSTVRNRGACPAGGERPQGTRAITRRLALGSPRFVVTGQTPLSASHRRASDDGVPGFGGPAGAARERSRLM